MSRAAERESQGGEMGLVTGRQIVARSLDVMFAYVVSRTRDSCVIFHAVAYTL